jgi:sugar transferase EpsL
MPGESVLMTHPIYDPVKRVLDIVWALLLLLLLSPVLAAVALAVVSGMGSPVLFRQQRPGRGEHIFTLYKFRTMRAAPQGANSVDAVASDELRLTGLGRFLRSTSIDELPQLYNVLKGEMSFIGPRPLLVEYLDRYTPEQAKRHDVRPGITGWAQVNGRNATSWEDRLAMDAWYAEHYSAALDFRVALRTVGAVFSRKGVSAQGQATVEPFVGQTEKPDAAKEKPENS